jgi:hypothetical protein
MLSNPFLRKASPFIEIPSLATFTASLLLVLSGPPHGAMIYVMHLLVKAENSDWFLFKDEH